MYASASSASSLLRATRAKLFSPSSSLSLSRTFAPTRPSPYPSLGFSSSAARSFRSSLPRWSHRVEWRSPLSFRAQIRAVAPVIEHFHRKIDTKGSENPFKANLTSLPKPSGGEFRKFYSLPSPNDPRIASENPFKANLTSLPKPGGGEFGKFYNLPSPNDPRIDYYQKTHLGRQSRQVSGMTVLSASLVALAIGPPLLGMMGFIFLASSTLLILVCSLLLLPLFLGVAFIFLASSTLLLVCSLLLLPLFLGVSFLFIGMLTGFIVVVAVALAGLSTCLDGLQVGGLLD